MMKNILFICFFVISNLLQAQKTDSLIIKLSQFLQTVKEHHPIAYQASLKQSEAELYLKKARGGFDPILKGNAAQKYFENKKYYSYLNSGLVFPTWFGAEFNVGYNNNTGTYLNSESVNSTYGLWNAGVSINLGKGLLIDKRRADLKQAEFLKSSTMQESNLILNQLLFDASVAFLDWYKNYEKVKLYEQNIENITRFYDNILQNVALGDKPAIDTLKLRIQIQDRLLRLEQVKVELKNNLALVNTFLWYEGFIPLEMDTNLTPLIDMDFKYELLILELDSVVLNHPEILMKQNELSISNIDIRLKKEYLKPELKLKYNALANNTQPIGIQDYAVENYNWGASVSYPIFTRKERADVKISELKIEQKQGLLENKKQNLKFKIEKNQNLLNSLQTQIQIQEEAVGMYQALLNAEIELFDLGESSMFLINTRDQNLINGRIKLIDLNYKSHVYQSVIDYYLMNF